MPYNGAGVFGTKDGSASTTIDKLFLGFWGLWRAGLRGCVAWCGRYIIKSCHAITTTAHIILYFDMVIKGLVLPDCDKGCALYQCVLGIFHAVFFQGNSTVEKVGVLLFQLLVFGRTLIRVKPTTRLWRDWPSMRLDNIYTILAA